MANRSQERSKEERTTPKTKDEYRKNKMKRRNDTQYLHLGRNHIKFHRKVKNLGLMMNDEEDQVSKVCRKCAVYTKSPLDYVELHAHGNA
jgi:hypothetical protein